MSQPIPALTVLQLEIESRSPLAFPERKPGEQFRSSLPFVPGATIYGALGSLLAQQLAQETREERERQIRAAIATIRCHNAYPAQPDDTWSRPLPMSALRAKNNRSAPPIDGLVGRVCYEQQQPAALLFLPTDDEGRPWEHPGWASYSLGDTGTPSERSVEQRVLTRVAIDRRRGTAVDRRLYSPLVISEVQRADMIEAKSDDMSLWPGDQRFREWKTRFLGSIAVPADDSRITPLLDQIRHLGGRQSTGLGAVTVKRTGAADDTPAMLLERVQQLTKVFRMQAALYERLGGKPWPFSGSLFTINLLADTILLDNGWLATIELSPGLLSEATGGAINATLVRSLTRSSIAAGWNVKWDRHKPTAVAVNRGSLYLFATDAPLTIDQAQALYALQCDGIGERRPEGYGQIRICDEFHLRAE